MGNNKGNVLLVVIQVALAIATVALACQANIISKQAKQSADTANQMFYQSQQPVVSAISKIDWTSGKGSETVTVACYRYPLNYQNIYLFTYIEIKDIQSNDTKYLPLNCYFDTKLTGNQEEIIMTGFKENNAADFEAIKNDFMKASSGFNINIGTKHIIVIYLTDFMGESRTRYYEAGSAGRLMQGEEAPKIISEGNANYLLAVSVGLTPCLGEFNGVDLWRWYIKQRLQPK